MTYRFSKLRFAEFTYATFYTQILFFAKVNITHIYRLMRPTRLASRANVVSGCYLPRLMLFTCYFNRSTWLVILTRVAKKNLESQCCKMLLIVSSYSLRSSLIQEPFSNFRIHCDCFFSSLQHADHEPYLFHEAVELGFRALIQSLERAWWHLGNQRLTEVTY